MTFDEVPPGQVPTRMTPTSSASSSWNSLPSAKARNGMMENCAMKPMIISRGRLKTTAKSAGFIVSPIPNMTIIRSVVTQLVFIQISADGWNSAMAAMMTTMIAMYFPTNSLNFSRNLITENSPPRAKLRKY